MSQPKLIDQVHSVIRLTHYSDRTEEAYWHWIKAFILFHHKRHPNEMAEAQISAFLSHLATNRKVSASTQNQALSALLSLYRDVLQKPLDWIDVRAKRPSRPPSWTTKLSPYFRMVPRKLALGILPSSQKPESWILREMSVQTASK